VKATLVEGEPRDRPLRVLVLTRSYPNDVLPTLGLWIERPMQLLARSCDVRVVSPIPYCPPLPPVGPLRQYARFRRIPRREVRAGIEVFRPRFLTGPGRTLYAIEAAACHRGIRAEVDRMREVFPFDLIHAHFIYPEGAVAHRLSRRYGVPFVVTEHAPWTERWFGRRSVRRAALQAAEAAAALLAVSTSVRDTIVSHTGDPSRIRVVPVGVDETMFQLAPREGRRRDQILYVGLINFNKGIDVLLHAMARLSARGEPGRLLLAGGAFYRNTRLQEEQLRALAVSLGLGDRVEFLGIRPPAEVAALMRESALVVLPSRAESFGAVLVEALASGTPVVATRCGGPEDIVHEEAGLLVPPEDPTALADAISAVLRDADRYDARELRARALSRFSWKEVVARTRGEYLRAAEPLVGRRGPRDVAAVGGAP
jgi:glycosyltransferase involved in cell wall biosynthesis